jgi:hypothetical protein
MRQGVEEVYSASYGFGYLDPVYLVSWEGLLARTPILNLSIEPKPWCGLGIMMVARWLFWFHFQTGVVD